MNYKDLRIYKIASELHGDIGKNLIRGRDDWKVPEINQLIRSSSSVCANIAEGYGRKMYPKDYTRFLSMAMASSDESQFHIMALTQKQLFRGEVGEKMKSKYRNLSVKILNLINFIRKEHRL